MKKHVQRLREHKFNIHLIIFITAMAASLGLYVAAKRGSSGVMWGLLAIIVLGNLVAIFI